MEWINNQWVIGIGTSIISGFLVFFFTRKFFTEKQKREYNQKIRTANNEILYAIRPLIVEKTKPNLQILNSVFYSTARKYGVDLSDIYDTATLCYDLTNEIMSNSFLSSEQKIELTDLINAVRTESENETQNKEKVVYITKEVKTGSTTLMPLTLSLMTGIMAIMITLFTSIKGINFFDNGNLKFSETLSIIFVLTMVPIVALTMTTFMKYIKEKEKLREKGKTEKDEISDGKKETKEK